MFHNATLCDAAAYDRRLAETRCRRALDVRRKLDRIRISTPRKAVATVIRAQAAAICGARDGRSKLKERFVISDMLYILFRVPGSESRDFNQSSVMPACGTIANCGVLNKYACIIRNPYRTSEKSRVY